MDDSGLERRPQRADAARPFAELLGGYLPWKDIAQQDPEVARCE